MEHNTISSNDSITPNNYSAKHRSSGSYIYIGFNDRHRLFTFLTSYSNILTYDRMISYSYLRVYYNSQTPVPQLHPFPYLAGAGEPYSK